ncbi:MAG: cytochrome-c peroxidase [Acidobacteria bacterium]|nr:cytochrome-c peroxidase [Acidobacteriota bacterium]
MLGKALYFDKRLSRDGTLSCATCHDPATAFADRNSVAVGVSGKAGTRNAPTILNAAFAPRHFWDGRASSLEEQAKQPLVNPLEMGMKDHAAVVARVSSIPEYRRRFRQVFGAEGVNIDTIVKAIATFERTQLSGNSPFDRFRAGDEDAISDSQKRGWGLFRNKAGCIECHAFSASSPFFTDYEFHNTGVATKGKDLAGIARRAKTIRGAGPDTARTLTLLSHTDGLSDLGRFLITRLPGDIGAFKTPTLRDVELTGPYMHDGSGKTLLDVVRFYDRGGERNPAIDPRMRPLNLSEQEMSDLVEFLRALTSDDVLLRAQTTTPQSRTSATPSHGGARGRD